MNIIERFGAFIPKGAARLIAGILVVALTLQTGCSVAPPIPHTGYQESLGRVAIISLNTQPDIEFDGFTRNKPSGAAKGAGTGFLGCVEMLGQGSCTGSICGAFYLAWLGVCGVSGVVGGVVGAAKAPSGKDVDEAESRMSERLSAESIQHALGEELMDVAQVRGTRLALPDLRLLRASGDKQDYRSLTSEADTVLEVALTHVGTQGGGFNPPLQLTMTARVRLVRTRDNTEITSVEYTHAGASYTLEEWSTNRAQRLLQALQAGYIALAYHIHDSLLLLYPFPDRKPHMVGFLVAAFGLAPEEPPIRGQLTGDKFIGDTLEWTRATSLRPTMRWQAFPRDGDKAMAAEEMAAVRNVRYDLIIARERNLAPGEIVYWREGLPDNHHTMTQSLNADARYFWSIRARFELNGRERVTEWGAVNLSAHERLTTPSSGSYRFKTP
ncbi:hypothetical protein GCM10011352_17420 [Marinobacterium zhoushanense]|uniref:Lipoprotein n=1 Tax=Marinobacterium zhoushanense TaxID=1679163 RepID=A0ABQ1KBS5_9GAMM|nr:hypothetical protein [Marinobacterium zhoushanense]GGB91877.1 hypothetical protein GCM10011352_17420 [Marinobacterium zhoushanense]